MGAAIRLLWPLTEVQILTAGCGQEPTRRCSMYFRMHSINKRSIYLGAVSHVLGGGPGLALGLLQLDLSG